MTKPYEFFIRFLITKGIEGFREANEKLKDLDLGEIDAEYFDKIYSFVHESVPTPVSNQILNQQFEGDFLRWMKVLGVYDLWQFEPKYRTPDSTWIRLVYDIRTDPHVCQTVNAMILTQEAHEDICQSVNNKYSCMLKKEHLVLYQTYFWNPEIMTRKDWKHYIQRAENYEKSLLFICMTEGREQIRTFLDIPTKADVSGALQAIFTNSVQKAKHYLRLSTKEANTEARAWIKTALEVGEKYKKYETGDVVDFGKTLQLEFEYVDTSFPTPDQEILKELDENKKRLEMKDSLEKKAKDAESS